MKGEAHPSLFAALSFLDSEKMVPIYYWVDRESFPVVGWMAKPGAISGPEVIKLFSCSTQLSRKF